MIGLERPIRIRKPWRASPMSIPIRLREALRAGGLDLERWAIHHADTRETLIDGLERKGYDVRGKTDAGICHVVRRPPTEPLAE
jgi:hypothetical protein